MRKTIFVLEDDESLRELFTLLLEGEGYLVRSFETVESFTKSLHELLPHLFILDVRLPDGDGMRVCAEVRSISATKNIPVIMMSAHRNFQRENGMCTANAFIAKPFDITALMATISQVVATT